MGNDISSFEQSEDDDEDLAVVLATLELLQHVLQQQQVSLEERREELNKEITNEYRRLQRNNLERKKSFRKLCEMIRDQIGDDEFKSEHGTTRKTKKTEKANEFYGGEVSGEIKIAMFLRMLAGASYLDVYLIHDVHTSKIYKFFDDVTNWINKTFTFPFVDALKNENVDFFNNLSHAFSADTDGVFHGCIGALDGMAVKIGCPTLSEFLKNPGAYFCRKGYYALNLQAMCDKHKRFLWISSKHVGGCHDSRAFLETRLYELLNKKKDFLRNNQFFIAGDSAYNPESFLLTPHEDATSSSVEDAYNFWHSNSRIRIECAFGELVMRWGIFWRTLTFDIHRVGKIISAAVLLHNFIVDERILADANIDDPDSDDNLFKSFSYATVDYLDSPQSLDIERNTELPVPLVTDNNEPHVGGRPTEIAQRSKTESYELRKTLTVLLAARGMDRPSQPGFKYNHCGMVYF